MADTTIRTALRSRKKHAAIAVATTNFRPLLSCAQIESYEIDQLTTWEPIRRMAMTVLSRSRSQLSAGLFLHGSASMLQKNIVDVQAWRDQLRLQACMADAALARLLAVSGTTPSVAPKRTAAAA